MLNTKSKLTLPVILERIKQKNALGVPLTEPERILLFDLRNRAALETQEKYVHDGKQMHIVRTNNAQPVIDTVRSMSAIQAEGQTSKTRRYLGSIDPITAALFRKESGYAIGTKEFAAYAMRRLNDDYGKFKA